jgi:hypothetical protein
MSHISDSYGSTYSVSDYSDAKRIFEFFADNTDVEWGHQILINDNSGKYSNKISTSHMKDQVLIPAVDAYHTPVEVRHSHPNRGFFSPADKYLYDSYNKTFGGNMKMRIYKAGFYHNFDNNREYPNLKSVPSYK